MKFTARTPITSVAATLVARLFLAEAPRAFVITPSSIFPGFSSCLYLPRQLARRQVGKPIGIDTCHDIIRFQNRLSDAMV